MSDATPKAIQILFVDDEDSVLNAIRRLFSRKCRHWKIFTCTNGFDALELLKTETMDAVVSDIQMPEMQGDELIEKVLECQPKAIRIILSAHAESDAVARALSIAHQFISKPFDTADFINTIDSIITLRNELTNPKVIETITSLEALPTMPEIYRNIMSALNNPDVAINDIATLISQDVALSTKILQVINSAYFSMPRPVESINEAVGFLGIDVVRSLCVSSHLFDNYSTSKIKGLSYHHLVNDSIRIGNVAKRIAEYLHLDRLIVSNAQLAGFLHNIGMVILAECFVDEYSAIVTEFNEGKSSLFELERAAFSTHYSLVGAYLLQLWSIPISIIQAVAYHNQPASFTNKFPEASANALTVVHIAKAVDVSLQTPPYLADQRIDINYLERLGIESNLYSYTALCHDLYDTTLDTPHE